MTTGNASGAWTLENFIREYGSEDIRIDAFYLKQIFFDALKMNHKVVLNDQSIIDKYIEELNENKQIVEFNTEEYYKYRYNPKLLSYDVYGTTELWFFILMANELFSISEFNLRRVIMYDAAIISKLSRILDMDSEFLEINSMNIKKSLEA